MSTPSLVTAAAYLAMVLAISLWAWRNTRSMSDYLLGGRQLGASVTALSAGASDMSGWLLLGLPGAAYVGGLSGAWIAIGLAVGAWCNWHLVARPLRVFSAAQGDALTIPDYFSNRFEDRSGVLRGASALVILLFFTFYAASGLVAGAKLFSASFGFDYHAALLIGAVVIVGYTFVGGFLAVSWTDLVQGLLMLAALLLLPLVALEAVGGADEASARIRALGVGRLDLLHGASLIGTTSLLAWGLGYFGQPHILVRFMAIESPDRIPRARRIGMTWMAASLAGAVAVGLLGSAWFRGDTALTGADTEKVFILLTAALLDPWLAGVLLAAILAAIMSTIDSQLLVSSSALTGDIYRYWLRPQAGDAELVLVSRLTVLGIALLALALALDPQSRVLALVSYAWAGLGASFGPVMLMSLYWRGMSRDGALAGLLVGAVTVVTWSWMSGGLFDLYEIVPGFLFAVVAIVVVSLLRPPAPEVAQTWARLRAGS